MKLNLFERLMIQQILPQEGNFATLKILNSLKMSLAPSEDEYKEYNIRTVEENGASKIIWDIRGTEEKEIEIGEKASDIIKNSLLELDKSAKLKPEHLSICEKFLN